MATTHGALLTALLALLVFAASFCDAAPCGPDTVVTDRDTGRCLRLRDARLFCGPGAAADGADTAASPADDGGDWGASVRAPRVAAADAWDGVAVFAAAVAELPRLPRCVGCAGAGVTTPGCVGAVFDCGRGRIDGFRCVCDAGFGVAASGACALPPAATDAETDGGGNGGGSAAPLPGAGVGAAAGAESAPRVVPSRWEPVLVWVEVGLHGVTWGNVLVWSFVVKGAVQRWR